MWACMLVAGTLSLGITAQPRVAFILHIHANAQDPSTAMASLRFSSICVLLMPSCSMMLDMGLM